jgi:hypothetical protein
MKDKMPDKASYDQWMQKIEQILTKANKLPVVEDSFPFPGRKRRVKSHLPLVLKISNSLPNLLNGALQKSAYRALGAIPW